MAADILVVDDEADIRELVAGILTDEGYDVRTATDEEIENRSVTTPGLSVMQTAPSNGNLH